MTLEDLSDELLMRELQDGHPDALSTLYNRYYTALLAYLQIRIKQDKDSAEDVLQSVFLRVHKHRLKFRVGQSFRPWIYAMADRLAKNANRDFYRRSRIVRPDTDLDSYKRESLKWQLRDQREEDAHRAKTKVRSSTAKDYRTPTTAELQERQEWLAKLNALPELVDDLPSDLRQIAHYMLRIGGSFRKAEVALGVGRRTIQYKLHKACQIIRRRMDADVGISSENCVAKNAA